MWGRQLGSVGSLPWLLQALKMHGRVRYFRKQEKGSKSKVRTLERLFRALPLPPFS